MQKKTAVRLIAEVKANYRYTFRDMTDGEVRIMAERWYDCLKAYSDEQVESAFRVALCSLTVPPTIADIVNVISRSERLGEPSDSELWSILTHALSEAQHSTWNVRQGFVTIAEERGGAARNIYGKLPELVRAFADFDTFCDYAGYNEVKLGYERARFLKSLPELRLAFRDRRLAESRVPRVASEQSKKLASN